ncbi:hypothetical protein EKO04_002061 [Ascochyta lentis]|uniref:DUF3669 domain-containing protein n=1 Tax=Ascochyta lentis TaxID=205686 RepID=A0A8H7JDY9_9PLEO|nr:hypothetical protein EKO04_002061 [Ascochyta lentis]
MPQPNARYHCIGKGFCGSVWTLEASQPNTAIKREDGGPNRSVTNDYNMHLQLLQSAAQHPPSLPLSIPHCHALIQPTDPWWQTHLPRFPSGYSACRALISERIPPVPRSTRNKLVDLHCSNNALLSTFVKTNPDDAACLLRPYLGRRKRLPKPEEQPTSRFHRFTLRNAPLHIDQMESLGLDTTAYAESMADALALLHWGAGLDANDVEFVLAPPRDALSSTFHSDFLGTHTMWILDFDCCRSLAVDEVGMQQACAAFFRNDPYFPRPGSGGAADEALWGVFKRRFLVASWGCWGRGGG